MSKHKNNVSSNPINVMANPQAERTGYSGHQHSKSQKTPQMSFSPDSMEKEKHAHRESEDFFMVDIPQYFDQEQSSENTPRITKEDEYLSAADYYSTLQELKVEKKIYKKQLEELQWYEKKFEEAESHLDTRKKFYQEAKNGKENLGKNLVKIGMKQNRDYKGRKHDNGTAAHFKKQNRGNSKNQGPSDANKGILAIIFKCIRAKQCDHASDRRGTQCQKNETGEEN